VEISSNKLEGLDAQDRRESGEGVKYPGARDVWGPAVAQKYKIHHNASI